MRLNRRIKKIAGFQNLDSYWKDQQQKRVSGTVEAEKRSFVMVGKSKEKGSFKNSDLLTVWKQKNW